MGEIETDREIQNLMVLLATRTAQRRNRLFPVYLAKFALNVLNLACLLAHKRRQILHLISILVTAAMPVAKIPHFVVAFLKMIVHLLISLDLRTTCPANALDTAITAVLYRLTQVRRRDRVYPFLRG